MKATGRRGKRAEVLVATLGTEPQVVTITLDRLLAAGRSIGEAVVVHTNAPRVAEALETVAYSGEFDHVFRFKSTTRSDSNRPVNPV